MSAWTKERHESATSHMREVCTTIHGHKDIYRLAYLWCDKHGRDALAEIERLQCVIEEATTLLDLYQSNRSPGLRDLDEQALRASRSLKAYRAAQKKQG